MKRTEAIHKARVKDYGIWKAAEDGSKKLIRAVVEEVYIRYGARVGGSKNS